MKLVWAILSKFLIILSILVLHFLIINFLPYPINHINIIFLSLLWLIILYPKQNILWIALAVLYISELFTSMAFGISSIAMLISLSAVSWFLFNIFTDRSFPVIILSSVIGLILYRFLFFLFLIFYNLYAHQNLLPGKEILADVLWEIFLSSLILSVIYLISYRFSRRLNPKYIDIRSS